MSKLIVNEIEKYDAGQLTITTGTNVSMGGALTVSGNLAVDTNTLYVDAANNRVGIGTSSPAAAMHIIGADENQLRLGTAETEWYQIGRDASGGLLHFYGSQSGYTGYVFGGVNGERMRIDSSGNVGINTQTAPGSNGKGLAIYTSDYPRLTFRNSTTGDGATDGTQFVAAGSDFEMYNKEAGALIFGTSNTERMRIDSSGNIIYNLPSIGGTRDIQFPQFAASNAKTIIRATGTSDYRQHLDILMNTAQADVAPTTVVRIDNSGNVGIGGIPTHKLYVRNDVGASTDLDPTSIKLYNNSDGGAAIEFSNGVAGNSKLSFGVEGTGGFTDESYIGFSTSANGATASERMRIDSIGNVQIQTSGAELYFSDNGQIRCSDDNHRIRFRRSENLLELVEYGSIIMSTGATTSEKMRIDSSGNVGIGNQNPVAFGKFVVQGTGNLVNINATSGTASQGFFENGVGRFYLKTLSGSNGLGFYDGDGTSERMRITSGGQLFLFGQTSGAGNATLKYTTGTGAVTYDTSSRLVKEDIETIPYGLNTVLSLSPKKYRRIDSDDKIEVGFIADEVQQVVPELVGLMEKKIFTKNELDTEIIAGSVEYDKMTAILVKAIQEQQEIINDLKARIETLEAK